jgi:starch phosphorylase
MLPIDERHYAGTLSCEAAGRYGYTVRVVPRHPDLGSFAELGRVTWVDEPPDGPTSEEDFGPLDKDY